MANNNPNEWKRGCKNTHFALGIWPFEIYTNLKFGPPYLEMLSVHIRYGEVLLQESSKLFFAFLLLLIFPKTYKCWMSTIIFEISEPVSFVSFEVLNLYVIDLINLLQANQETSLQYILLLMTDNYSMYESCK